MEFAVENSNAESEEARRGEKGFSSVSSEHEARGKQNTHYLNYMVHELSTARRRSGTHFLCCYKRSSNIKCKKNS